MGRHRRSWSLILIVIVIVVVIIILAVDLFLNALRLQKAAGPEEGAGVAREETENRVEAHQDGSQGCEAGPQGEEEGGQSSEAGPQGAKERGQGHKACPQGAEAGSQGGQQRAIEGTGAGGQGCKGIQGS